jgi:hypothetical protein
LFELAGVPEPLAREAMSRAMHKLPMKCRFKSLRGDGLIMAKNVELAADKLEAMPNDKLKAERISSLKRLCLTWLVPGRYRSIGS